MTDWESLAEDVRSEAALAIAGSGSKQWLCGAIMGAPLDIRPYAGVVEFSPDDQVVVVKSGTLVAHLQEELARAGLCLPFPDATFGDAPAGLSGTVGGGIAMNLPHALEAQCGNWREWTLGMTILRPDGTFAKCGSKAVKNVAGYDVVRLMVGSRGTLGVVTEVILKLYPLRGLPRPDATGVAQWGAPRLGEWRAVARFDAAVFPHFLKTQGDYVQAYDRATRTAWLGGTGSPPDLSVAASSWISSDPTPRLSPTVLELMRKAKSIFDPHHKLNPGGFGSLF